LFSLNTKKYQLEVNMADSSISQNHNLEDAMKSIPAIPEGIHEELIDLLLKMPLDTIETDDFINSAIQDSSVSTTLKNVVQEGNFRFDQSFLDNLNFRGEKSELVANSLSGRCLCPGGVRKPCPCP
jgi:hypothetical protein